jgi:hypothetical protein
MTLDQGVFVVKADLPMEHRDEKLLDPGFLVSPQEREEFPLDISEQSRPTLKTALCFRHPDRTLLDQLPGDRVQLGEKERKLPCQAILNRLVLPQQHLTGEWLICQHAVDDHILCLVLKPRNRHLHSNPNELEEAALDDEPFFGVSVFGETSNFSHA